MTLTFSARIEGREIACEIGSDENLAAPVFCFSLMAAPRVVSGGTMVRRVAGYGEVQLPDLNAGEVAHVRLAHENPDYAPRNRAWLPLGAYLRVRNKTMPLPPLALGIGPADDAPESPPFDGLRLIPQPTGWRPSGGTLTAIGFAGDRKALGPVARLAARLGLPPFLTASGAPVAIETDPSLPAEAYVLILEATSITLRAAGPAGIFAAGITLLNLRETYGEKLPCGTITDAPRFGYRGQHLDCARHFFQIATIRRLLDVMALFKLNRFHWHFADDEAFRLQVDCAPDLWRLTAFRGEGLPVPGVFGGGIRAGGSYSRADVAALIAHAIDLHIEILPEIEVPAHSYCINAVIPGLTDQSDPLPEVSIQGYPRNILNPAKPETWALLEPLTTEVASLFPIGILHLGCDELPPAAWDQSPAASALKSREGLQGRDDLQGWTMARLAGRLTAQGIRPAAWEEAAKGAQGGIGHNALLFSWTGQGPGVAAARMGHDVVMCPAQHTYLDMAHTADPDDWGAAWAGFIALEDTVSWKPIPKGAEDIAQRVVGVQGCFWGEFTTEDAQMEPMLAPRILGLANKAWDVNDSVDGVGLRALAGHYAPVFDRIGWARYRMA
ncbi:MAG: beta-N-acetylhexosaminidase [Pseudomonadota bacterium]